MPGSADELLYFVLCGAFPDVTKIQDTTVDTEAMTLGSGAPYGYAINGLSFQQEIIWTHNGWQYVVYYNRYRHVCLSRRQLPSGPWQKIEFTDYTLSTTTDAHNVVTMGICPNNGTIHLSFDHHGQPLNYRVSQTGVATNPDSITWSTALFGPVLHLSGGRQIVFQRYVSAVLDRRRTVICSSATVSAVPAMGIGLWWIITALPGYGMIPAQ